MTKGINRYEGKDKRRQRRRNHIARDLHKSKYHQRVIRIREYAKFNPHELDLDEDLANDTIASEEHY